MVNIEKGVYWIVPGHPFLAPERKNLNLISFEEELQYQKKQHQDFLDGKVPNPCFYKDVNDFFADWLKGYEHPSYKNRNHGPLNNQEKGFDLKYVNWDVDSKYFNIGDWEGVSTFGVLEGITIATDLNGIMDISGFMNLVVNDFDNQKILVHKPKEYTHKDNLDIWEAKKLLSNEDAYHCRSKQIISFPYDSLNAVKTDEFTWTAVGFEPIEIYDALRNLGFKF